MNKKIDAVRLQAMLQGCEKLPLRYAALLATMAVNEFNEQLLLAVEAWMNGTLTPEFGIGDCTLQDIMDDTDAGLMEALFMMHLQLEHPERIDQTVWVLRGEHNEGIIL